MLENYTVVLSLLKYYLGGQLGNPGSPDTPKYQKMHTSKFYKNQTPCHDLFNKLSKTNIKLNIKGTLQHKYNFALKVG